MPTSKRGKKDKIVSVTDVELPTIEYDFTMIKQGWLVIEKTVVTIPSVYIVVVLDFSVKIQSIGC